MTVDGVMDEINWTLLSELQRDARISYSELSRKVSLSPPAVAERIKRMEEAGVLTGYRAVVDPARLGWGIQAIVQMPCHGASCILRDPSVLGWPEVLSIDRVTGDACSILRVMARSIAHFETVIDRLAVYGQPSSSVVLSSALAARPVERPS